MIRICLKVNSQRTKKIEVISPGGYFHIKRWGVGPHIKFAGKIWGKVWPSSPNERKTTRCKSWEKIPILGSYLKFRGQNLGYLSLIFLEAKFGAPTRISEVNFVQSTPTSYYIEVPPPGFPPKGLQKFEMRNSVYWRLRICKHFQFCCVGYKAMAGIRWQLKQK